MNEDSAGTKAMSNYRPTVIGIDVGGCGKGFHAVALCCGAFVPQHFMEARKLARWCQEQQAQIIAIDAPCAWATVGGSRLAERSLTVGGATIQCFKTPTRASAVGRAFYGWVFNGEKLYHVLDPHYRLFEGTGQHGKIVFETFPHAVVCSLAGRVVPARPKSGTRRAILRQHGFDDGPLTNIDFVDAALCALTAERFRLGRTRHCGDAREGLIVVPT